MVSSEMPRLGPSVVGVRPTAERTPGVARASASAAGGRPGPLLVTARSPDSARVALLGDGVVLGGRAEQQRAAHRDGEHQGRAGGGEAPRGGAQVRRGQEAADRRRAAQAAARGPRRRRAPRAVPGSRRPPRGRARSSPTSRRPCPERWSWPRRRTAAPRRRAPPALRSRGPGRAAGARPRPGSARGSAAPARRAVPAPSTASSAARTPPRDGGGDRQPAGADGEVRRGDVVADEPVARALGRGRLPARAPPAEPTRPTIAASHAIMRRI